MAASTTTPLKNCEESEEHNKENERDTTQELPDSEDRKETYHSRSMFYKKPIKKSNIKLEVDSVETPQEIRRQKLLEYQKKNRNDFYNASRGIFDVILNPENGEVGDVMEEAEEVMEEANLEDSRESEVMEVEEIHKRRPRRYPCYANKLMMSEWMLEVPQDLADKWIMVPCPKGKRVLVVACKGSTKIYSRQGFFLCKFNSALPGGSYKTNNRNLCTILDCIWIKGKQTCHVLDILVWSSQYMVNCETEFRFFWLKSRMQEISELTEQKKGINEISLLFLPTINCNEDFNTFLNNISSFSTIDGLLFYHKEAHYTEGRSPLVAWLKTYMLPEALGVTVPEPYDEKPSNYLDFQHHIQKVLHNEKTRSQNQCRKKEKRLKTPEKEIVEESME